MSETLKDIVVDVSEMKATTPTCEKSSVVGNAAAKHQFREVTKMMTHEEVTVAEMQQPLQPVADCHGLNAAKMRDACANIAEYARAATCHTDNSHLLGYLYQIEEWAEAALFAPPRNCDRFATLDDARNAFFADYVPDETCYSAAAFAIWIFDKVKGESK